MNCTFQLPSLEKSKRKNKTYIAMKQQVSTLETFYVEKVSNTFNSFSHFEREILQDFYKWPYIYNITYTLHGML